MSEVYKFHILVAFSPVNIAQDAINANCRPLFVANRMVMGCGELCKSELFGQNMYHWFYVGIAASDKWF